MGFIPPFPIRIGHTEETKEQPKHQTDIFPEIAEEEPEQSDVPLLNRPRNPRLTSIISKSGRGPRANPSIISTEYR